MKIPSMRKVRCGICGTYMSPTAVFYKDGRTIICLRCMWKLGEKMRRRK